MKRKLQNYSTGLKQNLQKRKVLNALFFIVALLILAFSFLTLIILLFDLFSRGSSRVSYDFFFNFPSRLPERAGILSAWVGSLCVMLVTASVAIPLGIFSAIYLEMYAKKNWVSRLIEINILNLAAIPSITFGLMALGLFVYQFGFGQSILTAGLTLGLLILPLIIVATREAIKTIPHSIHEAGYALGSTKWQLIQHHILPYSTGGILTGVIIALSRAIGETAPLITIGALTFIAFLPTPPVSGEFPFLSLQWIMDPFTVLPIQMFNWVSRPQEAFHVNAAATGSVLLVLTLCLNAVAIYIRYRFRKKMSW
ncbi:MAG: phosphate ABC transporter permease PstA [Pseudobdellovibrionaceae bacterium]